MTQSEYNISLQQRLVELQNETDAEFVYELVDILYGGNAEAIAIHP